jgi:hypothetical protein
MDIRASAEGAQGPGNYDWWDGPKAAAARAILARYEIVMWGGPVPLGGSYSQPRNYDFMHWALKPGTAAGCCAMTLAPSMVWNCLLSRCTTARAD